MRKLIKNKKLNIVFRKEEELSVDDKDILFYIYKTKASDYVILKRNENIYINPDAENSERLMELAEKILNARYLDRADKWFDEWSEIAGEDADDTLCRIWFDWRQQVSDYERNEEANAIIKKARGKHIYRTAHKNRHIIKEIFDIGFGVYNDKAECDWNQGAQNCFMYGYLLGLEKGKGGGVA